MLIFTADANIINNTGRLKVLWSLKRLVMSQQDVEMGEFIAAAEKSV